MWQDALDSQIESPQASDIWKANLFGCSEPSERRRIMTRSGKAASRFRRESDTRSIALHGQLGELLELPGAVAQLLRRHAQEVQHRELQVGQRRVFRIDEMAAALESARASAD